MTTRRLRTAICGVLLATFVPAFFAQTPAGLSQEESASLAAQVSAILSVPMAARAHWGVAVTALDGTPIYGLNEGQLFQPASNAKLYMTAAAMAILGPDKRFETRVTGRLDTTTGRVKGDLFLRGAGDANFDSGDIPYVPPAKRPKGVPPQPHILHDIDDLVAQLVARGVREVDGDVVGDDTLFPWEPYGANWAIDDAVWGYGAPVSALTIADNQLRMTMRAGAKAGEAGTVTLEQAVPYYTIQGQVETVQSRAAATGMQVVRMPGSRVLRILGSMAVGSEADVEEVAIEDPAEYAAMALREALMEAGISVRGAARAKHREVTDAAGYLTRLRQAGDGESNYLATGISAGPCLPAAPPREATVLATHTSRRLAEDVVLTNKISQNLHAELLLHQLGSAMACGTGSTLEGARIVRAFLLQAGLDPDDFVFYDGSGLSGHDLVTPRGTARLLAYAASDPPGLGASTAAHWFAEWRASLPVAGEDGSLNSRFAKAPLKDHVFAKTGTLSEVRALSGYIDAASGRRVIFSIMVGNHMPGTDADRIAMDKIVAAIEAAE